MAALAVWSSLTLQQAVILKLLPHITTSNMLLLTLTKCRLNSILSVVLHSSNSNNKISV